MSSRNRFGKQDRAARADTIVEQTKRKRNTLAIIRAALLVLAAVVFLLSLWPTLKQLLPKLLPTAAPSPAAPPPAASRYFNVTSHTDAQTNERQEAVVTAMKWAWKGYKEYAWGKDMLRPVSKTYEEWFGVGLTLVDALDTLWLMGLKQEFAEAQAWVQDSLNFDKDVKVNLFETTIRMLGGLLSAYHLSGEKVFLDRAIDLAD
eukprot:g9626.t1